MKRLLLTALIALSGLHSASAWDAAGANITYRKIGTASYEVKLQIYRDCNSADSIGPVIPNTTANMTAYTFAQGLQYTLSFNRVSIEDVSSRCNSDTTSPCSNRNASNTDGYGLERHTFLDTVDFGASPFSNYVSQNKCEVNFIFYSNNVNNSKDPNSKIAVRSMLNVCLSGGNNSVILSEIPFFELGQNRSFSYNMGAFDKVDRDSISYSFASIERDSSGVLVPDPAAYTSPRSFKRPIAEYFPPSWPNPHTSNPNANPSVGTFLDPITGDFIVTPVGTDYTDIVIEATEWRNINGSMVKVGFVRRQSSVKVVSKSGNNPPTIGTTFSHTVCQNSQICFTIQNRDNKFIPPPPASAPPGDSLEVSWNGGIENATMTIDSATTLSGNLSQKNARFCWTPGAGDTSRYPYTFTVRVKDNNCTGVATTVRAFSVKVKRTPTFKDYKKRLITCGVYEVSDASSQYGYPVNHTWRLYDSTMSTLILTKYKFVDTIVLPYEGRFHLVHTNNNLSNCPNTYIDTLFSKNCYYSTFTGLVWRDSDTNCVRDTVNEKAARNEIIHFKCYDGFDFYVNTDKFGNYSARLPLVDPLIRDTFTISHIPKKYWRTVCPVNPYHVVVDPDSTYNSRDFFTWKRKGIKDLQMNITGYTGASIRRGQQTKYLIEVNNPGTETIRNFKVYLQLDSAFKLDSSMSNHSYVNSHLVYWDVDSLMPDSSRSINFFGKVPISVALNSEIIIKSYTDSNQVSTDSSRADNRDSVTQRVIAAYDPNDKQSTPADFITSKDKTIDYLIRFQNVGNATATKVTIIDTIDVNLPISSVVLKSKSHSCQFFLTNNVFTWVFDNINLPDSASDPAGSQGFVRFSMKLKPDLQIGYEIKNKAYIYFDYEAPVRTNTAKVTKVQPTVRLISPNNGPVLKEGSIHKIEWISQHFSKINISWSKNGAQWLTIVNEYQADLGYFFWKIPSNFTNSGIVRIQNSHDPSIEDFSDTLFSIVDTIRPRVVLESPDGGEVYTRGGQAVVKWTALKSGPLDIYLSLNNGQNWVLKKANAPAQAGTHTIQLPDTFSDHCRIKIVNSDTLEIIDISDTSFIIIDTVVPRVVLKSPNGGETFERAGGVGVQWTSVKTVKLSIYLSINDGSSWSLMKSNVAGNKGQEILQLLDTFSDRCRIKVINDDSTSINDISDNAFTIRDTVKPRVILISPNGGDSLYRKGDATIKWTSKKVGKLSIYLSVNNGSSWQLLKSNVLAFSGQQLVQLPDTYSVQCQIMIKNDDTTTISDVSDGTFMILDTTYRTNTVPDPETNTLIIYPNPASDELFIRNSSGESLKIEVFNATGMRITRPLTVDHSLRLDVEGWPAGVYFVRSDRGHVRKLVISTD